MVTSQLLQWFELGDATRSQLPEVKLAGRKILVTCRLDTSWRFMAQQPTSDAIIFHGRLQQISAK
jgi:hypothetical protein